MGKNNIPIKIVCENRKARHDYFIHETYEAGIELVGTEVKSLRAGKANLKDSFALIKDGEIYLENMHVSPYDQGNQLFSQTREKGWTLVPLKIYFKHGRAKLALALASGKHNYDKRQDLRKKADQRDIQRALKERQRD